MSKHENVTDEDVHTPYRQVFANAAARTADATLYTADDINKKALQVDTGAEFRLSSFAAPITWTAVGDGAGGDMETTYGLGGAITTLDMTGGNDLAWDSATPDPVGLGLFAVRRNNGGGEPTILKAPVQPDDSANDGTPLFLVTGSGANQVASGNAGGPAGDMIIGAPQGAVAGGAGAPASGGGQPGKVGGGGGSHNWFGTEGGVGGAGSGADDGGQGGTSATLGIAGGQGGKGGVAGVTGAAGGGGSGSPLSITAAKGGEGGNGTAAGAAGAGANGAPLTVAAGNGGGAGTDGGGGGGDGGDGLLLELKSGEAGLATGGGTDGDGGDATLDTGGANGGGGVPGEVTVGAVHASAVKIGRASVPIPMVGIPQLPSFTVATVPNVATFVRGLIFVSDETGGAVPAYSDGTNWRRFSDGVIVS